MKIRIVEQNGIAIATVESERVEIHDVQDALDLMADCYHQGARDIIIQRKNLCTEFFDLATGIAGEILQKFSNYRARLAIVGDFSAEASKSLKDFIYESNKTGRIFFVSSTHEALDKLTGK